MLMIQSTYLIILLMFSCLSQTLKWFILLELLSWNLAFLLEMGSFNYLLIQSMFMPLVILGVIYNNLILMSACLMFKMGLPPFHIWLIKVVYKVASLVFTFIMTIHKLVPVLLLISLINTSVVYLSVLLSLISVMLLVTINNLNNVLVVSSFFHSGWMLLASTKSILLTIGYWVIYSIILMMLVSSMWNNDILLWSVFMSKNTIFLILILSGIPPFCLFWWKVSILELISYYFISGTMMLLFSVISMWIYLRTAFLSFFFSVKITKLSLLLAFFILLGTF